MNWKGYEEIIGKDGNTRRVWNDGLLEDFEPSIEPSDSVPLKASEDREKKFRIWAKQEILENGMMVLSDGVEEYNEPSTEPN
jgi:hypothetical protein